MGQACRSLVFGLIGVFAGPPLGLLEDPPVFTKVHFRFSAFLIPPLFLRSRSPVDLRG